MPNGASCLFDARSLTHSHSRTQTHSQRSKSTSNNNNNNNQNDNDDNDGESGDTALVAAEARAKRLERELDAFRKSANDLMRQNAKLEARRERRRRGVLCRQRSSPWRRAVGTEAQEGAARAAAELDQLVSRRLASLTTTLTSPPQL